IGLHLNNMLGESHLTSEPRPGERLMSLMAPSVLLQDGRPRLVLGSAGSRRLHGAILQVVANVAGRGLGVNDAVEAPRMHVEAGIVHCEDAAAGTRSRRPAIRSCAGGSATSSSGACPRWRSARTARSLRQATRDAVALL